MGNGFDTEGWSAERRCALVLSILKGETSVAEAARDHGLTPAQIKDWEMRFLKGAERALRSRPFFTPAFSVALLAVLIAWIGLRIIYWNGYYAEDSPGYVTDAIYVALGEYDVRNHVNGLNVGTYVPVALPIKFLGKSELALSIWPMMSSLLGVVSLGGAATILFGRWYGWLAALLYATYPGDIFFSTVVMPDAIQAGWLSFSVYLIVLALSGFARSEYWTLAAGGVAMGICHLIRANDVILVPVGVSAVVILSALADTATSGRVVRRCVSYLSGWVLIHLLQGLVYLWATGDFFHRLRVVNGHYGTPAAIARWGLNADPLTIPFSIVPVLPWWMHGGWGTFNPEQAYHALTFLLALSAVITGSVVLGCTLSRLFRRATAGFAFGTVWLLWPLVYHQFGSQSLTQFVPMHRLSRHLVVYAPGAIFATVAAWFLIREAIAGARVQRVRRFVAPAVVSFLVVHLVVNVSGAAVAHEAFHAIKRTYVRIREHLPQGVGTIVADPGDLCFLDFWLNPLGVERIRMMAFANYAACDQFPSGVVLTWSNPGWQGLAAPVIRETVTRLPCLIQPPPTWRLLYDGYPEKIFIIADGRVPPQ